MQEHNIQVPPTPSGFLATQARANFSSYSLSGFYLFLLLLWFFNTYFSSWMALSSEAPQPFSDPSLPCCRIPGAPAHIYQWKRKPFASLCPSGLALRIMGQWQARARSRQTLFQCEHVGLDELICELGSPSKSHKTNKTPNNRGCCSRSPTFLLKPWLL